MSECRVEREYVIGELEKNQFKLQNTSAQLSNIRIEDTEHGGYDFGLGLIKHDRLCRIKDPLTVDAIDQLTRRLVCKPIKDVFDVGM